MGSGAVEGKEDRVAVEEQAIILSISPVAKSHDGYHEYDVTFEYRGRRGYQHVGVSKELMQELGIPEVDAMLVAMTTDWARHNYEVRDE